MRNMCLKIITTYPRANVRVFLTRPAVYITVSKIDI